MSTAAKLEIHELLGRFALGYDERDIDMLSACFAADARFSMRVAGGDLVGPFVGREEIMKLMTDSMAEQTDVRRHVVSNIIFTELSDDRASVISNLTLFATENGEIQLMSAGIYRDTCARVDGTWVLAERHLDLDKAH